MATTATITPNQGSAPVTLQAGNYSAIDDRRFWGSGVREGVVSGGSYQVIQRAAGANMTVDVACSVGSGAVVQGDSVTAQGNYFVPPTTANVNVDIAAADATNPRNDLVVLEVKDDQHDAGGLNLARVRVITGTANASAVGTDAPGANGTPALPSSCLLLAVVRVTAGATSVTTAMINDRRPWAGGVPTFETSLPSPAVDGQEVYYRADSSNGVMWHLRYRNAFNGGSTSYPWEYVGGSELTAETASSGTRTATTQGDLSANTQEVTAPLAGDYFIAIYFSGSVDAADSAAIMALKIGSAAATVDLAFAAIPASGVTQSSARWLSSKQVEASGIAASSAIRAQFRKGTAGVTATIVRHGVAIRPIRVG